MRIGRDTRIAGVPAMALRNALRRLGDHWPAEALGSRLGLPEGDASQLCAQLESEGYLTLLQGPGEQVYYRTTLGNALANASAARPIKRSTADALVQGVIERTRAINADDSFVFGVRTITAFGSYVGSSALLGDVDLAVDLFAKHSDPSERDAATLRYSERARLAGRRFRSTLEAIMAPQLDVLAALKAKSRHISLHDRSELQHLPGIVTREIFSADPP